MTLGTTGLTREAAIPYIGHYVDDAGSGTLARAQAQEPAPWPITDKVKLVGWQCGFEPMFVAVRSYLDVPLDDDEAEGMAIDWLAEIGWFSGEPTDADFIL